MTIGARMALMAPKVRQDWAPKTPAAHPIARQTAGVGTEKRPSNNACKYEADFRAMAACSTFGDIIYLGVTARLGKNCTLRAGEGGGETPQGRDAFETRRLRADSPGLKAWRKPW